MRHKRPLKQPFTPSKSPLKSLSTGLYYSVFPRILQVSRNFHLTRPVCLNIAIFIEEEARAEARRALYEKHFKQHIGLKCIFKLGHSGARPIGIIPHEPSGCNCTLFYLHFTLSLPTFAQPASHQRYMNHISTIYERYINHIYSYTFVLNLYYF
jgi:hypothetical protein